MENGGDWTAVADAAGAARDAALAAANFVETRLSGTSAAIALGSDEEVAALNASYRGKPSPTNVLSFPAPEFPAGIEPSSPSERRFIGDIILAAETVHREAAELGIPLKHHLQHLVVHGLLHLSGFDHEDDEAASTMESLETRILATLEIPDPYAEDPATAGC
ncbi:MAG: rRNA maturation RNase YbeY [Alphaproteobacteria bacterium]|nr:rRNA maturation RNase YbeY [Alphaproteobacteria bacterium]